MFVLLEALLGVGIIGLGLAILLGGKDDDDHICF